MRWIKSWNVVKVTNIIFHVKAFQFLARNNSRFVRSLEENETYLGESKASKNIMEHVQVLIYQQKAKRKRNTNQGEKATCGA